MSQILLPKNISEIQRLRFPGRISRAPLPLWAVESGLVGDCIVWGGGNDHGYGVYNVRGKIFSFHRQIWVDHRGPLESWQHVDHLCRNRACFNLDHLEPVTQKENMHRGDGPAGRHFKQTHCSHRHELAGENLHEYTDAKGYLHRFCRTCQRRRAREQYQRQKAAKPL